MRTIKPAILDRLSRPSCIAIAFPVAMAAASAACGSAPAQPTTPAPGTGEQGTGSGTGQTADSGTTSPGGHGSVGAMKAVAPSAMLGDLQKLGLDPKALPPFAQLEPATLRKLMGTFSKSLGVKCTHCHSEADYHAPTPMKKVTVRMWDEFVRGLSFEDGSAVYCDSCHQGHPEYLDERDKRALGAWMEQNFVVKMKRRDGKEHGCETCHGDPFEGDFLDAWKK